jgi:hypothetical protein
LKRRPYDEIEGSSSFGGGGSAAAYDKSKMTDRVKQLYESQRLYERQQAEQAIAAAQKRMLELSKSAPAPAPATVVGDSHDDRDLPIAHRKNYETNYYPDLYSTDSDDWAIHEESDDEGRGPASARPHVYGV